jgi:large subunit ribosomal protein L25
MAKTTLSATLRSGAGKGVARKLRSAGQVPAVLYGHGDTPRPLAVDAHELELLMAAVGPNTIVTLKLDGEGGTQDVLLRDVQMHPYKPEVLHVDFFHVHAGEKIHVKVPVRLTGKPVGVHTDGGILDQVLYDLEIECLPGAIPDVVEIDVSALHIGESVRVGEVPAGNYKVLNDVDLPIASIVGASRNEGVETEEAPTEPALIKTGKDDEEE